MTVRNSSPDSSVGDALRTEPKPKSPARRCAGRKRTRVFVLAFALAYAVGMLLFGGATWTRLYAPSPYHRQQTAALLQGRLHIGDSAYDLEQSLVLHNGQVQQVWGLGVALWQVPFECFGRLIDCSPFPDRLALGVAFALLAAYSASTAVMFARKYRRRATAIGLTLATLGFPALLSLTNGRHLIYEDTSLYACLVSLGILTALIRLACFNRLADYSICIFLASMTPLVRPTHGIYALAGLLIGSVLIYARKYPTRYLWLGGGAFFSGLVILAATNLVRFGSASEFGHTMTVTRGAMIYFTRFDNPFRSASWWSAGKELCGALFLNTDCVQLDSAEEAAPGQMFFGGLDGKVVRWQTPEARWRDMYMTTFDWSYALLGFTAIAGTVMWLIRARGRINWRRCLYPGRALGITLLAWSVFVLGGLVVFYWYFPILSARYLLDLAPGFLGLVLLVWLRVSRWLPWLALGLLLVWLGCEVRSSKNGIPQHYLLTRQEVLSQTRHDAGKKFESRNGSYSLEESPSTTRIALNGEGWDDNDGMAGAVVMLVVDRPEFVELTVEPRLADAAQTARRDVYRARMGSVELPLVNVTADGDTIRVRFKVPEIIQRRQEAELLFLCFIDQCESADRISQRMLHGVRWR